MHYQLAMSFISSSLHQNEVDRFVKGRFMKCKVSERKKFFFSFLQKHKMLEELSKRELVPTDFAHLNKVFTCFRETMRRTTKLPSTPD